MKLEVWQRGMDLFELTFRLGSRVTDLKLRSQFTDSVQSISANVAEGYGRRSLPEYLQFLYTAKGSMGEALTRACGLWRAKAISDSQFEEFDALHYEVENKLLGLIHSMENKRGTDTWLDFLPDQEPRRVPPSASNRLPANTPAHQSNNPSLH